MFDGGVHTPSQVFPTGSDLSFMKKLRRIVCGTLIVAASACSAAAPLPPAQNLPAEQSTPFFVLDNTGSVVGDLNDRYTEWETNELP